LVFEDGDLKIYMKLEDRPFLKGIELDCVQEALGQFIKFNNPNAKGECGCGESFSVT